MRYEAIPGERQAILWADEHGSGVAREGDPQWADYLRYLAEGGELVQPAMQQITLPQALDMVALEVERVGSQMRAGYTTQESDSWPAQATEAQAWLSDNSAATPLIDALQLPYEDKAELCQRIVTNYQAYREQTGELIMWRRIATAAIEAYFATGRPIKTVSVHYPEVPDAS